MDDLKNQIINKAGFLIYTDYWEKYFSDMTGDQVKEVFKIIFHFNTTFEVLKTDDLAVKMVVVTIIDNIKRDTIKRSKQAIASAENGKLGGRPKKEAKRKQTKSKITANKPTIEEIKLYCEERKNNISAESFFDYYETRGWKLKTGSIKDWKACVRTWEKNNYNNNQQLQQPKQTFLTKQQIEEQRDLQIYSNLTKKYGGDNA